MTVGVTGASGAILAQKTLDARNRFACRANPSSSDRSGQRLFAEELGIFSGDSKQLSRLLIGRSAAKIEVLPNKDVGAAIASGSYAVDPWS